MIYDALRLIQAGLQDYIQDIEQPLDQGQNIVLLDNIAMAEEIGGSRDDLNGHIVMTLVNVEEETTLKNSPHYRMENGRTVYQNPPINLNLFILFSVLQAGQYETSLKRLASIIEFFQWKKEFSLTMVPDSNGLSRDVRVLPDLYTLTFDQLNHLWGSLGGKQVPFVMYRTRLVSLDAQKRQGEGEAVKARSLE